MSNQNVAEQPLLVKYAGADWLERQLQYCSHNPGMSELGRKVADCLGQTELGIYHIDNSLLFSPNVDWASEKRIRVAYYGCLSSFDFNLLTRLYLNCLRFNLSVEIAGAKQGYLSLVFSPLTQVRGITPNCLTAQELCKLYCDRQTGEMEAWGMHEGRRGALSFVEVEEILVNCHASLVRAQIDGLSFGRLQLRFSQRSLLGGISDRHPDFEYLKNAAELMLSTNENPHAI